MDSETINPFDSLLPVKKEEDEDNPFAALNPKRSTGEELLRQGGLTARHALSGAAKTFTGINDAFLMAANQLAKWMGMEGDGVPLTTPMVDRALDEVGLPKTENHRERLVGMASEFMSGAGSMSALGKVPQLSALANAPMQQAVGSATSGLAVGEAQERDMSPKAQVGVGLAAGLLPGWLGAGAASTTRGLMRGRNSDQMRQNINTFEEAGVTPTVGQVSELDRIRGLENVLGNTPFSRGPINRANERAIQEFTNKVDEVSGGLSPRMSTQEVGDAVEQGIVGPGGYVERSGRQSTAAYNRAQRFFDPNQPIELQSTRQIFRAPSALSNAPRTSRRLGSDYMRNLGVDISEDVADYLDNSGFEGLPYNTVKEIRSAVGRSLDDSVLVPDKPKAELKRLYGALSEDLNVGAERLGGPGAKKYMDQADEFYKNRMASIERIERVVELKGGPEKVYGAVMSNSKDGATTLKEVMDALGENERNILRGAVIRKMGEAIPSSQNAAVDRQSLNTYLTNWAKTSDEAKQVLFGNEPELIRATNALAKTAELYKDSGRVLSNISGSARMGANIGSAVTVAGLLTTGNLAGLASFAGAGALANGLARAMTNKNAVMWLAKSTNIPAGQMNVALNDFIRMAEETGDPELLEIVANMKKEQK